MSFIPDHIATRLKVNGQASADQPDHSVDHHPVLRIYFPCSNASWLISESDPENPDLLFGLCDLGMQFPELGYVSRSELEHTVVRGLRAAIDPHFKATHPLSVYARAAHDHDAITLDPRHLRQASSP